MLEQLTLCERVWIRIKSHHKLNKIFSIVISLCMAYWTLGYKHLAYGYYRATLHAGEYPRQANLYNITLWLTFIYFAFQALAELLELYSSVLGKDRGALGLLFEMNQLMGITVSCWVMFWVVTGRYKITNPDFIDLETFVVH